MTNEHNRLRRPVWRFPSGCARLLAIAALGSITVLVGGLPVAAEALAGVTAHAPAAAFAGVDTAQVALTAPPAGAALTIGGPLLASPGVVTGDGAPPPPATDAASYVVADLDTGAVLAAKAAHQPELPASTLKILTALTVLPVLDPAEIVVGTDEAAAVEGSKAGIYPGLKYSIDLVFKAMLLQSGNDAAITLALAAGGVDETVDAMNVVAHDLHALDTLAVNTNGLDAPGQVTSAYDLALITRAALARDDFRTYVTTLTADMPDSAGATYQIQNENKFFASYDGAIGVKNGYTEVARHTFVGAAERGGRTLVVTLLKTEGRPEPVVAALMDWGFANADATPVGQLVLPSDPLPTAAGTPPPEVLALDGDAPEVVSDPFSGADPVAASSTAVDSAEDSMGWAGALVTVGALLAAAAALLRARVLWRQRGRP